MPASDQVSQYNLIMTQLFQLILFSEFFLQSRGDSNGTIELAPEHLSPTPVTHSTFLWGVVMLAFSKFDFIFRYIVKSQTLIE